MNVRIVKRWQARISSALLIALLLCFSVAAQERSPTLDNIMSAPFPEELSAASSGGKIAWVQNAQGVRNIWVAEAPDYRGRQVTNYTRDDGQELTNIKWTPDARTMVYVRGGAANRQGEAPNPANDPAGVDQSLWRVSVSGGEPVKIGAGSEPALSPRGDVVAFTRRGQIFSAPLDGSKEAAQLINARGAASSLRWSHDNSKIAFTSARGDHNFIGVYDMAAKTLRFLEPSVDRDSNPVWSPDNSRIAFIRIPTSSAVMLFRSVRRAHPWSIMLADVATNRVKTVWRAQEGRGSAFWPVVAENQLLWSADNQLIFPWERDGWLHLYSVSTQGGEARLLTPGEFEVEYVTLSPDRRQIFYNSNQGDIDRRHLWRVPVNGGEPVAITRGNSIEWSPLMISDNSSLAFLRADAKHPAHAAIQVGSSEARELTPATISKDFPERTLIEPQPVTFTATDGMQIRGQLFVPSNLRQGERRPAIVFLHGGSRRQMLLGWHYNRYYNNAYALNQYLASRGYIVLSVNFRSGIGYGMEFREALNYGAGGASEFNDVLGAGLYLRSRLDVDAKRIGLWGGSYGGYLTAHGLARASNIFAAGVDFHGVHDWNVGIRTFIPGYNPLERPEDARLAFQSSPLAYIDGWRSPVLVIHGDDDRNVSFSESVALVEKLRERGVEVEQLIFPDEVHGFLKHSSWLEAYRATVNFFRPETERANEMMKPQADGSPQQLMKEQQTGIGIAWCDGEVSDFRSARVALADRGFLFGDGIYEVVRTYNGKPFAFPEHLARLSRSAQGIELELPMSTADFTELAYDLVNRSGIEEAEIYIQVTRGAAPRNPLFPSNVEPTVVVGVLEARRAPPELYEKGCSVALLPDQRWARCDLKTVCLLPNVLAKQQAYKAGFFDALMIRDRIVTEGTASNVFLRKDEDLITPIADKRVLAGITRGVVIKLARAAGYNVVERDVQTEELFAAQEVFITSTTLELMPVVKIDDCTIGAGKPGSIVRELHKAFRALINDEQ